MKDITVIQNHIAYENNILKSDYFKQGPNSHLQNIHVKIHEDEDKHSQEKEDGSKLWRAKADHCFSMSSGLHDWQSVFICGYKTKKQC